MAAGLRERIERRIGAVLSAPVPPREDLPSYLAPVPKRVENLGLRLAWVVVAVNVAGTAFGFYYYLPQFSMTPVVAWPVVPDSPTATLFVALAVAAWKLGRSSEWLNALAFFGSIKLGAWTPFVLLAFMPAWSALPWWMYHFLLWSHLAMVVQAFVLHRFADFPVRAVALATGWYLFNDVVDYFVSVAGGPHHTLLPPAVEPITGDAARTVQHASPGHEIAAAGAVVLTVACVFLALSTRVKKLELRAGG